MLISSPEFFFCWFNSNLFGSKIMNSFVTVTVLLFGFINLCTAPAAGGYSLDFSNGINVVPSGKPSNPAPSQGCELNSADGTKVQVVYDANSGYHEVPSTPSVGGAVQTLSSYVSSSVQQILPQIQKLLNDPKQQEEIAKLKTKLEKATKDSNTKALENAILEAQNGQLKAQNAQQSLQLFAKSLENGALKNLLNLALEQITALETEQREFNEFVMGMAVFVFAQLQGTIENNEQKYKQKISELQSALNAKENELKQLKGDKKSLYCQWFPYFRILGFILEPKKSSAGAAKAIMGFMDRVKNGAANTWQKLPSFYETMKLLAAPVEDFHRTHDDAPYLLEKGGYPPLG